MAQNPLHGITLKQIVSELESQYGWAGLYQQFNFNCFKNNPSINSSLKFLRKTAWARQKVEHFYLSNIKLRHQNNIWKSAKK